ncbi:hypothetical protein [Methylobacterium sp. E-046]|uniref:hypothetical protein n=1 Tax=Methylobacterium sp. E-046 TaxID=2836576 RepID=UPI001FB9EA4B|nr:hypothetical protein [Methylobacterium sp. E-046]MCJ2098475.1 hypothetical protein [Methylobacterium sp. E-046]
MTPGAVPIGVTEDVRGFLLSLPCQFWLVVGLRRTFPRLRAADEAWTYLVPPGRDVAARIEGWIAEVELQVRAEARRRSWTATDAEWNGAGEPEAPRPVAAEPAIVVLPKKRTARSVLQLLADLAAGAVMVATVSPDGVRGYRLAPAGRRVRTAAAERAIDLRLIVPGNDGLFGPEWSQTWRAPTAEEVALAAPRPRKTKGKAKPPTKRRAPSARAPHHPSTIPCSV